MWRKELYCILYILLQNVQSIRICSDDSSGMQRTVNVEMENVSGPCTCDLLVTVAHSPSSLIFNTTQRNDVLCSNIKLVFKNNQITDKTWCGNDMTMTIDTAGSWIISMIVNGIRNSFKFSISTAKSDNSLQMNCHIPSTQSQTGTNSSSTFSLPSPTTISNQLNADDHSTKNIRAEKTHITTERGTRITGSKTTLITTDQIKKNDDSDDISYLPIILGCSVGGTVVIILVIVIVGCVLFRRRQTTTLSNTENNKHGEMIITDNDVYISSDSIPNNNNQHGTKNMAEMEIIPNDLYQSSDSLADDLNDSRQHEHVPGQIEQVPNTNAEYAVVKKKPKKVLNTDTAIELNTNPMKVKTDYDNVQIEKDNLKIEIDRTVGPKGDAYTLVNKC